MRRVTVKINFSHYISTGAPHFTAAKRAWDSGHGSPPVSTMYRCPITIYHPRAVVLSPRYCCAPYTLLIGILIDIRTFCSCRMQRFDYNSNLVECACNLRCGSN